MWEVSETPRGVYSGGCGNLRSGVQQGGQQWPGNMHNNGTDLSTKFIALMQIKENVTRQHPILT